MLIEAFMHEIDCLVARRAVENIGGCVVFGKIAGPVRTVIDGGGERHHRVRIKRYALCRFLQQTACLIVQPVLQFTVEFVGTHFALIGRSIVRVCQLVHRVLMECNVLIEPDGIGQTHHGCAVVAVLRVPHVARLASQGVDPVAAEHIEDLLTAFAVRQLGEHGDRHIEVDRGADAVFRARSCEQLARHGGKERFQAVGITRRTALCRYGGKPCVIFGVEGRIHVLGVRGHLRVLRLADGISGSYERAAVRPEIHACRNDCDKQCGSRGHPPGPARGAFALVLFAALKQILVGLPDAFIQIVLIHTDIPPGSDGAEAFFVCG